MNNEYAWHFAPTEANGSPFLANGDGRRIFKGQTLTVKPPITMCMHGLHASALLIDALSYMRLSHPSLCTVELGGTVISDPRKSVATERTCINILNVHDTKKLIKDFCVWSHFKLVETLNLPKSIVTWNQDPSERNRARAISDLALGHNSFSPLARSAALAIEDTLHSGYICSSSLIADTMAAVAIGSASTKLTTLALEAFQIQSLYDAT